MITTINNYCQDKYGKAWHSWVVSSPKEHHIIFIPREPMYGLEPNTKYYLSSKDGYVYNMDGTRTNRGMSLMERIEVVDIKGLKNKRGGNLL